MLKIALTGGVASGKSTVARMFRDLGAVVLDADEVARAMVAPGQPALAEIRRAFGPEYFHPDGTLDRAKRAERVFSDPKARETLNEIIHPRVTEEIRQRLALLEADGADLVIVEVPLLFEAGLATRYDQVIVVYAGEEDQVRRLAARDERDPAEIAGILDAQWPLDKKRRLADYVVDNRGSLEDTLKQVHNIWQNMKNLLDKG